MRSVTSTRPAQNVVPQVVPPRLPQLGTQTPLSGIESGGRQGVSVWGGLSPRIAMYHLSSPTLSMALATTSSWRPAGKSKTSGA